MIGCNLRENKDKTIKETVNHGTSGGDDFSIISGKSNSQGVILIT
jgi:hypothetical protein